MTNLKQLNELKAVYCNYQDECYKQGIELDFLKEENYLNKLLQGFKPFTDLEQQAAKLDQEYTIKENTLKESEIKRYEKLADQIISKQRNIKNYIKGYNNNLKSLSI